MADYEITEDDAMLDGWWNHRVFVEYVTDPTSENPEAVIPWYSIRETFYDGNGKIWACDSEPCGAIGESLEELQEYLEWMKEALNRPVVNLSDIPEKDAISPSSLLDGVDLSTATPLEKVFKNLEGLDDE